MQTTNEGKIREIIGGDTKLLVEEAEEIGKFVANRGRGLATSQIRNVFGAVKKLEIKAKTSHEISETAHSELLLLIPRLAYMDARAKKRESKELKEILSFAIKEIKGDFERFLNFCKFFEAILAYHRASGGKS